MRHEMSHSPTMCEETGVFLLTFPLAFFNPVSLRGIPRIFYFPSFYFVYRTIPRTCDCITLHDKTDFADRIKLRILRWEEDSELSRCSPCNQSQGPWQRLAGESVSERLTAAHFEDRGGQGSNDGGYLWRPDGERKPLLRRTSRKELRPGSTLISARWDPFWTSNFWNCSNKSVESFFLCKPLRLWSLAIAAIGHSLKWFVSGSRFWGTRKCSETSRDTNASKLGILGRIFVLFVS